MKRQFFGATAFPELTRRFGKYVRKLLGEDAHPPGRHGAFIYRITIDDEAESRIVKINS